MTEREKSRSLNYFRRLVNLYVIAEVSKHFQEFSRNFRSSTDQKQQI